jgi:hypothetical protein
MKTVYLIMLFIPVILIACESLCDDNGEEKYKNPNPPESNALILTEKMLGSSTNESTIWQIIDSKDGNFFFLGKLNVSDASYSVIVGDEQIGNGDYEIIIGKLTPEGQTSSLHHPGFEARFILRFDEGPANYHNGLVGIGIAFNPVKPRLIIYDNQFDNYMNFTSGEENAWFNSIVYKSSAQNTYKFVAAGGITIDDIYYPYLAEILVNTEQQSIETGVVEIYSDYAGNYFTDIEMNDSKTQFYCTMIQLLDGAPYYLQLAKINSLYTIDWVTEIYYQNEICSQNLNSLTVMNDKAFVVGSTEDDAKGLTSQGNKWLSGLAVCINASGEIDWKKKVSLTQYSEKFHSVTNNQQYIFAVGVHSSHIHKKDETWDDYWIRENGFISKINCQTGEPLANYSLGNEVYSSGINSLVHVNNQPYAAGWTNQTEKDKGFQGWLLKLESF